LINKNLKFIYILGDIVPLCFVKQAFIFTFRPTQLHSI